MSFDESALDDRLSKLPNAKRAAFAATCVERLAPAYRQYSRSSGAANQDRFDSIVTDLWAFIERRLLGDNNLPDADLIYGELSPQGDLDGLLGYADDAVAALAFAVRTTRNGMAQDAVWAARRVYEAMNRLVVSRLHISYFDEVAERKIENHELVVEEFKRQNIVLEKLETPTEEVEWPRLVRELRLSDASDLSFD